MFDSDRPYIIAGPCSAESEEQVMGTATALKAVGVGVFRAGIWKPRTHPGCFEGIGEKGLDWLRRVKDELGMKVCTEVASFRHVEACLKAGVDILWVGARTTANPFLVQEIAKSLAGTDTPVLIKNPISPDLELWAGAVERFRRQGVDDLGLIHRGCTTSKKIIYRNSPEWHVAVGMKSRFPELPFLCDPSHMAGKSEYVAELSQKALDLGFDGLMIESHRDPSCALSDAAQQLTPDGVAALLSSLKVRRNDSDEAGYRAAIETLRARIDVIDKEIVEALGERMEVSREIGRIKKESNISIIQTLRWESLMAGVRADAAAHGLDPDDIAAIFDRIHGASVAEQNRIIEDK